MTKFPKAIQEKIKDYECITNPDTFGIMVALRASDIIEKENHE